MDLGAGSRIAGFEITAFLGEGGMGEVYRARDLRLQRDVAIKVLRAPVAADPDDVSRVEREARVLASLNHPHIGAIYSVEDIHGLLALVLELVEGETLAERVARGPLPVHEALRIARQIVDALDAAHAHDIVHRDLKPANIKVRPDGTVKVLDFGLAKTLAARRPPETASHAVTVTGDGTRDGLVLGTPAYMSPEQARGEPVDGRTDVWAFGCVLFELLTGTRTFGGASAADMLAAVIDREPDWRALPEGTPSVIRRLLNRCLAKDPRRRLRAIGDAGLDIDEALDTSGAAGWPPTAPRPPSRRRWFGPHLIWVAVSGVLLALLVAATSRATVPPPQDAPVVTLTVMPPRGTMFPRGSGAPWPLISPDGRRLAFVASRTGQPQRLWVRALDSAVARELEATDGAVRPFWSPDSRSLGYFANGTLARVDVDTGVVRVLTEAPYAGGLAGAWGDGAIVYTSVEGLARIAPTGGSPSLLRANREGENALMPAFLPDGRLLYIVEVPRGRQNRLCVQSLDAPEPRCTDHATPRVRYASPGFLLISERQTLVARRFDVDRLQVTGEPLMAASDPVESEPFYTPPPFSVSSTGVLAYAASAVPASLTWLDRAGAPLGGPVGPGGRPALSPDGTQLLVERDDPRTSISDVWSIDLEHGTESRVTSDRNGAGWPAFSRDGARIAYAGTGGIHVRRASGDDDEALGVGGANPDFSPDGRFILFQRSSPKTGYDLWTVAVDGERRPVPFAQTEHGEREGRFSPDGRWVAYDSTESGRREIWMQPFPATGSRRQVSTQGGVSPQWRRDGRELYYVAADGALMAVAIDGGTTLRWGPATRLFQTTFAGGVYADYAVSSDGQRFLVPVPPAPEDDTPITVVVNWTASLQK